MTYFFRKLMGATALFIALGCCPTQTAFALATATTDIGLALSIDAVVVDGVALEIGDDPEDSSVFIVAFGGTSGVETFEFGTGTADAGATTDLGPNFLVVGDFIEQIVSASAFVPEGDGDAEARIGSVLSGESTLGLEFFNESGGVVDITIGFDTTFLSAAEVDGEFVDAFADGAIELFFTDPSDVTTELSSLAGFADGLLGSGLDEDLDFGTFQFQLQDGEAATLEGFASAFATAVSFPIPEPTSVLILAQVVGAMMMVRPTRSADRS